MSLKKGDLFVPSILNDVQILVVDNDRDSRTLYAALFESYGVAVTATESVKEALDLLNRFMPDILICETRFLGESVYPLIQQIRYIAQNSYKVIPIFAISTFPTISLAEHLKVGVEAYQIKPIDLNQFVNEVCSLLLLSKITQPLSVHDWLSKISIDKTPYYCARVG